MIYLDNAATTFPKPACVQRTVLNCMQTFAANPGRSGHALAAKASEALYEARTTVGDFFGAAPERVIFTMNCTHGINYALKGTLQPGDHIIISSLEHNAAFRPLHRMQSEGRISFDIARVVPGNDEQTVQNFAALIRENTKMIFCIHVSNVFGTELPIRKLGALAKSRRLLFGVDAAQSAGTAEINMKKLGIDLLCLPGHKGLFGPMGTGALLLSENVEPVPIIEGGTGSLSLLAEQPTEYPDRLESGTVNLPGILGLMAGIRFIKHLGGCNVIHRHEAALIRTLKNELHEIPGVTVFDRVQKEDATLLSFSLDRLPSEEVAERLNRFGFAVRAGFHCAAQAHLSMGTDKNGTVRVSPGVFNELRHIKSLIFYVNQIAMTV